MGGDSTVTGNSRHRPPFAEWEIGNRCRCRAAVRSVADRAPGSDSGGAGLVMDSTTTSTTPTREELNAELVAVPEPPEQPEAPHPPGFEDSLEIAVRHVKGRRGGDLVGIILVGSGARRAVTP